MDDDEYGKIDAMKLQATKGTILSCIINANMSDTETNENYILENVENKPTRDIKIEPTSEKRAATDPENKS